MGKKIKPISLLDTTINEQTPSIEQEIVEDTLSIVGGKQLTSEMKDKLEKYDALEKSVGALAKEKESLEEKLAEYATKLAELQSASNQISALTAANSKLQEELDAAKDGIEEVHLLKKEIADRRNEIDGYLVRISELTFENSNLTCQLDELKKKVDMHKNMPGQQHFPPNAVPPVQGGISKPLTDAYNVYASNGYGSWN